MHESLEHDFWLKILTEDDRGGGLEARSGQGGNVVYEPGIADRRESRRYCYEVVVECHVVVGQLQVPFQQPSELPAVTQNISRNGMAILSNVRLAPEQVITIRFTHQDNGKESYRVSWARQTREGTWLSGLQRTG